MVQRVHSFYVSVPGDNNNNNNKTIVCSVSPLSAAKKDGLFICMPFDKEKK